ncbi:flippase [Gemella palaticanis]|uniref:Flippase n=2 Tax=Gemelliphila palaticanis TaxID=81950 RepID=A0ABX2T390_9BACL|nr:flippase [Gemella palaticanis]NYS47695.1 flippase [Gemella palaticanis]
MLLTISSIIFPLITFPYVSRILQAEGVGKVSFATSIVTYFLIFSQLGIPTYGIRACAKVRDDKDKLTKTVQELIFINIIMTIIAYIVFFTLFFTVERINNDSKLFLIMSSSLLFNVIGMEWLYKSLEQYTYITIRSLIFKVIGIFLMFIFVNNAEDYAIYGAITIFAVSASNILNLFNSRKFIYINKFYQNYNISKHLKAIFIFFALSAATTIYTNMDNVILGFLKDDSAVGYYNTAVRIKMLLLSIVTSLGAVLLPRLSYYVEQGNDTEFIKLISKSFQFILFMSTSITVYFVIFAKESIYLLAGSNFENSILIMQIIMPTVIFIGFTNLFGIQILVPLGKEKIVLYSVISGSIVSLLLNFILIPNYSFIGAAIANLLAELVVLIIQSYYIKNYLVKVINDIQFLQVIVAIILSALASISVKYFYLNNFTSLIVSSFIFYIVYYITLRLFKNKLVLEIEKQIFNIIKIKKRN